MPPVCTYTMYRVHSATKLCCTIAIHRKSNLFLCYSLLFVICSHLISVLFIVVCNILSLKSPAQISSTVRITFHGVFPRNKCYTPEALTWLVITLTYNNFITIYHADSATDPNHYKTDECICKLHTTNFIVCLLIANTMYSALKLNTMLSFLWTLILTSSYGYEGK